MGENTKHVNAPTTTPFSFNLHITILHYYIYEAFFLSVFLLSAAAAADGAARRSFVFQNIYCGLRSK
jgi:hypothetical protein